MRRFRNTTWSVIIVASLAARLTDARGQSGAGTNPGCENNGAGVFESPDAAHSFTITGGQVSGAGATLFNPFFASPASTNDWLDVDNDGNAGFFNSFPFVDQL